MSAIGWLCAAAWAFVAGLEAVKLHDRTELVMCSVFIAVALFNAGFSVWASRRGVDA